MTDNNIKTNNEEFYYCRSLSRLTEIAEQFIIDDLKSSRQTSLNNNNKLSSNQRDLKYYLNQCIHILSNYKDQCKLLKDKYNVLLLKDNNLDDLFTHFNKDIWIALETSYIYYKIIHIIILNKIPNLKEFLNIKNNIYDGKHNNNNTTTNSHFKKDRDLLEIYNDLLKTLLNDENILQIKWLLKKNNSYHSNCSQESTVSILPNSGSTISSDYLINTLLKTNNPNDFLFIDVRPRVKYNASHIDMPNVLCLEPVSFKDIYSDYELEKKSMITSGQSEIDLFNRRNLFKFIILYCDDQCSKSQQILATILLNKSFEKPIDNNLTKIYTLENGISDWTKLGGKTIEKKDDTDSKDPTPDKDANATVDQHDSNYTHSVYLNGDTSGLNLKSLPKMTPSVSHSMDQSMRDMMSSNTIFSSSVPTLGMSSSPSTLSYPFINNNNHPSPPNISNFTDSYTLMAKQTSGTHSITNSSSATINNNNNNPKRSSSLKRLSALLPSFKNSSSNLSPQQQRQQFSPSQYFSLSSHSPPPSSFYRGKDSPRLPQIYSTSTSAVSLSSSHSLLSQNGSNSSNNNNIYTTYPDTRNLLQHTNLRNVVNNGTETTLSSPPQLPKLPQKVISTTQNTYGSLSSLSNMDISHHKNFYSSSPSLYPSQLISNYGNDNTRSFVTNNNNNDNSSIIARKLQTETLQNPYNLDFIVGLENMGNSCYLNCIIQCLLGTHELTKIFLNNSYEKHINLKSKLGSKGVIAKNFAQLVNTMYNHATFLNDPVPLRQFGSGNSNNSFGDNSNSNGRTSMLTSNLLMRKKENNNRNSKNNNKVTPVRPQQFKVACGSVNSLFKDCSQQDCQEFCQFLLDGLHEDLNQNGGNPPLKELSKEAEEIREKMSLRIASTIERERYLTTYFSVILDFFQ